MSIPSGLAPRPESCAQVDERCRKWLEEEDRASLPALARDVEQLHTMAAGFGDVEPTYTPPECNVRDCVAVVIAFRAGAPLWLLGCGAGQEIWHALGERLRLP